MNSQSKYPELTYSEAYKFYAIVQSIKKDPNYLKESPYSETVKNALKEVFQLASYGMPAGPATGSEKASEDIPLDLEREIKELYLATKETLASTALDDKEKAAVQKTAANQLEKLLDMAERSRNIRWFREYENRVVKVLKKVLPAEREEFIRELVESEADE